MDYNARIQRFQALLAEKADVAFLPVHTDLEYLVGVPRDIPNFGVTLHPGAWLEGAWLTASHAPVLALPRMTAEFGGLGRLTGVDLRVLGDWDDPASMVADILKSFNLPARPRIALSNKAEAETVIHLQKLLPDAVFVSATDILRQMRVVKDADEIEAMRRAGAVTEAAFTDVLSQLRMGMTELDIVAEVDYQLRRHGALGPSFTTSLYNSGPDHPLMFGDRLNTWKRPIQAGVSVLFDFGAAHNGWCYDFGRTVSFGAPSEEQIRVYDLVMASQRAGIAALKVGNTCEMADAAARQVIEDGGLGEFFRHRLGHGIGMDVHEPPFLTRGDKTVFQEGMMFTVEPSITQIVRPSARVEDVVVVRPNGGEPLTTGFQSLIVVE
ncbi:aminopeptidase P family protein [Anaerolineae bacterium CFX9]|nr:aminopeptidase P family protein [Anaerolineae bacterium CFX9]